MEKGRYEGRNLPESTQKGRVGNTYGLWGGGRGKDTYQTANLKLEDQVPNDNKSKNTLNPKRKGP